MKAIIIILFTLVLGAGLWANPAMAPYGLVSEVWFNDSGHLMVEFSYYSHYWGDHNFNDLSIEHGGYIETIPLDANIPVYDSTVVLDITQLMPHMVFNPLEDTLIIRNQFEYQYESDLLQVHLQWGNDFSNDASPLQPGQSYVFKSYAGWLKDGVATPDANPFEPTSRSTIRIIVRDLNNHPVPDCAVHLGNSEGFLFTDQNGVFVDTLYAGKQRIRISNWTMDYYDEFYWLEPEQTYDLQYRINTNTTAAAKAKLKVYPSPYNLYSNWSINFVYESADNEKRNTYVKIYDTKGRFVCKLNAYAKGVATWEPDKYIASGIYYATLFSGNRIIDTKTFVIVK